MVIDSSLLNPHYEPELSPDKDEEGIDEESKNDMVLTKDVLPPTNDYINFPGTSAAEQLKANQKNRVKVCFGQYYYLKSFSV